MGIVTDFYAFDRDRFDALRRARKIRTLATALVTEARPPLAIATKISIDKVGLDDIALMLERAAGKQLAADHHPPRFFTYGLRRIAHPHADIDYWDPFYSAVIFDQFDELADRLLKIAKTKCISRPAETRFVQQPDDTFQYYCSAYKAADLATVLGVVRAALDRKRGASSSASVDAFSALIALMHRAIEPLSARRRGPLWTIVRIAR